MSSLTPEQVAAALKRSNGIMSKAAAGLGCSATTVRNYIDAHPCLAQFARFAKPRTGSKQEREKSYRATANGRAATYAAAKKWRRSNWWKARAADAVKVALGDGRLLRAPCERCGSASAQAHHADYSKPLDVLWLCAKHHKEWHAKHGPGLAPTDLPPKELLGWKRHAARRKTSGASAFKGVSLDKRCGRWVAQIWKDGEKFQLGRFDVEAAAAEAYDAAARQMFGSLAALNFPHPGERSCLSGVSQ